MGRYRFQDDDDDDDTAFSDSPSRYQNNSSSTEREEGEIIEDDESRISDDYDYDRWKQMRKHEDEPNSEAKRRPSIASYISTLSSFSSFSGRKRNSNNDDSRSPSPDPSFREGRSRDWSDGDSYQNGESDDTKDEYRLVGSTKYDRNYCKSDFYPSGIRGNTSYDSNHSSTNPISDDDDGYTSNSNRFHPSNGSLIKTSSHQKNPSNGNPEIHYHIYVSEKQASRWFPPGENVDPFSLSQEEGTGDVDHTQRRGGTLWKKITVLAVLTQLLALIARRYDFVLLSPPPSYLTWEEYGNQQIRLVRKVSREGSSLLQHLATATYRQITRRSDLQKNEDIGVVSPRYEFPKVWESLAPPSSSGRTTGNCPTESCDRSSSGNHRTKVFGQDVALEHLRSGLNHWSSSSSYQRTHRQWDRQKRRQHHRPPLVVYASGGKGVGKGSLAYLLLEQLKPYQDSTDGNDVASLVVDECAAKAASEQEASFNKDVSNEAPSREYYCPLLHITPSRYYHLQRGSGGYPDDDDIYYADNYDGSKPEMTESGRTFDGNSSLLLSPLYQEILDHVVAAGGGASIVVLDRVDAVLDCENGGDVCGKANGDASWVGELVSVIRSQPALFGNTIFVLTSQVGTGTLEKWTRKRLQSLRGEGETTPAVIVANAEAEALLKYELQLHFSGTRHGNKGDADDAGETTSMGIEDWLLVPMSPLDKTSMASLLDDLAKNGPNQPFFGESGRDYRGASATFSNRRLLLTERASDRILDALEWHQWIHKTSGEILRIWSPEGAIPLLKLWEERVLEPISDASGCPQVAQWDVLDTASSKQKTTTTTTKTMLVLDLDENSIDRLWLRSCKLAKEESEEDPFVLVQDGTRWNCPRKQASSCVFYL